MGSPDLLYRAETGVFHLDPGKPTESAEGIRWIDNSMGPGWWHLVSDTPTEFGEGHTECGLPIDPEAKSVKLDARSRPEGKGIHAVMCDLCLVAAADTGDDGGPRGSPSPAPDLLTS
jgi:hypothetical protein